MRDWAVSFNLEVITSWQWSANIPLLCKCSIVNFGKSRQDPSLMCIPSQLLMLLRAMGSRQLLLAEDRAESGIAIIHREQSQNLCLPTLSRKEDPQFCKTPRVDTFGFLWYVVCVCSVTRLCPTLCNPTDCSPPGSCVRGIFQARILEWAPVSYSRGSFQFRDRIHVSCVSSIGRQVLNHCTTWEASDVLLRVTKSRGDTILGFLEGFDQDEGNIFS